MTRSALAAAVVVVSIVGVSAVALSRPTPPELGGATLCRPAETPMFSCSTGRRIVSVCGRAGGATYRFGTPGRVELTSDALRYARTMYSGGGEAQVSFVRGNHRYIVFERTVRTGFGTDGLNNPEFSAGVMAIRGDRIVSRATCRTDATFTGPVDRLPPGKFVLHDR